MRKSVWSHRFAAGFAVVSGFLAIPAQAESLGAWNPSTAAVAGGGSSASEKVRRLDIMLMVTGLRCRATADDFQVDFQAFEARHMAELNGAARTLVTEYSGRMSTADANRALDRISVQIANQYGNGHPWLGRHDLKELAQRLAQQDGPEALLQAADEILDGDGAPPAVSAAPTIAYAAIGAPTAEVRIADK